MCKGKFASDLSCEACSAAKSNVAVSFFFFFQQQQKN